MKTNRCLLYRMVNAAGVSVGCCGSEQDKHPSQAFELRKTAWGDAICAEVKGE